MENLANKITGRIIRNGIKQRGGKKIDIKNLNNASRISQGYISLIEKVKNDKNKTDKLKDMLDYLTIALRSRYSGVDLTKDNIHFFNNTDKSGKFSITREGIKNYLNFIFGNFNQQESFDNEIEAILEMCTHRHTSFTSVGSYTNTTKEFLKKIGVNNINNENLKKLKNLLESKKLECNKKNINFFVMIAMLKNKPNYSDKIVLLETISKTIDDLDTIPNFDGCLIDNYEIYKEKLKNIINQFKIPNGIKKNAQPTNIVDLALNFKDPFKILLDQTSQPTKKFVSIASMDNFLKKTNSSSELQNNIHILLSLIEPISYNNLFAKFIKYYNENKDNPTLNKDNSIINNLLKTIKTIDKFELLSSENKNSLLNIIPKNNEIFYLLKKWVNTGILASQKNINEIIETIYFSEEISENMQNLSAPINSDKYNNSFTQPIKYQQQGDDSYILNNLLSIANLNDQFELLSTKNKIYLLSKISDNPLKLKKGLVVHFIEKCLNLTNVKNLDFAINVFSTTLNVIDEFKLNDNPTIITLLYNQYNKFKDTPFNKKDDLILIFFKNILPDNNNIPKELISHFLQYISTEPNSCSQLKATLINWINFPRNEEDFNSYINIIDDNTTLETIISKKFHLLSIENKNQLLNKIINHPRAINAELAINYLRNIKDSDLKNADFAKHLFSKYVNLIDNINDDNNKLTIIKILYKNYNEFKDIIRQDEKTAWIQKIFKYSTPNSNIKDLQYGYDFLNHIKNNYVSFLPLKGNFCKWISVFKNEKHIHYYVDICYNFQIIDPITLGILLETLNSNYSNQKNINSIKKLSFLLHMYYSVYESEAEIFDKKNLDTILNAYKNASSKIYVWLLFKNPNLVFSPIDNVDPLKYFLTAQENTIKKPCTAIFEEYKSSIINIAKYFTAISSITDLTDIISYENNQNLYDKLLLIKNININIKKSLENYSLTRKPEYTQKRLQQLFAIFVQALFNEDLTSENLIKLINNSKKLIDIEKVENVAEHLKLLRTNDKGVENYNTNIWKMLWNAASKNDLVLSRKNSNASNATTDTLDSNISSTNDSDNDWSRSNSITKSTEERRTDHIINIDNDFKI